MPSKKATALFVILLFLLFLTGYSFSKEFRVKKEEPVQQLVASFFDAKQQDFVSEADHSLAEFFVPDIQETLSQQTFSKVFRWEKLVRRDIQDQLLREDFQISIEDISVQKDSASAAVTETYTYLLDSAEGQESVRGSSFTVICQKTADGWKISDIETRSELSVLLSDVADVDAFYRETNN